MSTRLGQWFDRVWPQRCALCDSPSPGTLCSYCTQALPPVPGACPVCALPTRGWCNHPPSWRLARLFAPFHYGGSAQMLVVRLKYENQRWLGPALGQLIAPLVEGEFDLCVPVPLHRRRLRERGFNQAREIALGLCTYFEGLTIRAAVRRSTDTPPQSRLAARERRNNLRGAFTLVRRVEGLHVLVVDDVVTTGSTINELASVLLGGGAATVSAAAFARAAPHTVSV